ncbi:hypothetical protein HK100_012229 [Physocladia obscura]|uniref:Uncharacterized protein n=1 Tax=Physocladia obscura TaxID=109957 RepID=A0AAD5XHR8_9FUNG|nr:hypothetical protein HK100_012229 [Physocladia obscura]
MSTPTTARSSEISSDIHKNLYPTTFANKQLEIEADERILAFELSKINADLVKTRLSKETARIVTAESAKEAESRVRSAAIELECKKVDFDFGRLLILAQRHNYGCSSLMWNIATRLGIFDTATTENAEIPSVGDRQELSKLSRATKKLYKTTIFNAVTLSIVGISVYTISVGLAKLERYVDFHHWKNTAFQFSTVVTVVPVSILAVIETSQAIFNYFSVIIVDVKQKF